MLTKLEQVSKIMVSMSTLELESAKSLAQAHIDKTVQHNQNECRLLQLPAELRDLIYYFSSIIHIQAIGNSERCGLLATNKQCRSELQDIFHSEKVARISVLSVEMRSCPRKFLSEHWTPVPSRKFIRAVLDHATPIEDNTYRVGFGQQLHFSAVAMALDSIRQDAKFAVEFAANTGRRQACQIHGVLELSIGDERRFQAFKLDPKTLEIPGLQEDLERVITPPLTSLYPWSAPGNG